MTKIRSIFLKLLRRRNLHRDLEAELAHHRELAGMHNNPVGLGNTTVIKEQALELWRFTWIENFWRDFIHAARRLRRNPAFTVTAGLSLALGIGLTTAMFTLLNAAAFRPLPYPDAGRLVWITQVLKANSTDEITLTPDFLDWRRNNHSFTELAAYNYFDRALAGTGEAVEVHTAKASAALLRVLGEEPFLGRNFSKEEDYAGHDHVAILSYPIWQMKFAGDRAVIGQPLLLDGRQFTVIGVLPRDFTFPGPDPVDILTPLGKDEAGELARNGNVLTVIHGVIGRLRAGIMPEQARADLTIIQSHLPPPAYRPTITIKMLPLREFLFGNARVAGFILVASALFFLLITSANVGSLLLVRLMQRDRELAVRTVLGGSRGRILSQLLTENALLSVLASAAGVLLAYWLRRPLLMLSPYRLTGLSTLPFDTRVLAFAVALSVLTVLVFGLTPALRATGVRVAEAMKAGQSSIAGARETLRKLSAIAICEVAAVLILSTSAALMLQSFWKMRYANLGFQSEHTVAATINLVQSHYRERQQQLAFMDELLSRARVLPGIESVALTKASEIPPGEGHAMNTFKIEGRPLPVDSRQKPIVRPHQIVNAAYFRVMHIPLLQGRLLQDSDRDNTVPVAVVNHTLAARYFPHETALGHRIQTGASANRWCTIVGVVGDIKTSGLATAPEPVIYYPYAQTDGQTDIGIVMRSALPAETIASQFRKMMAAIDPSQPVSKIETLDQRLNESVSKPRFTTSLLFAFACLATLVGIIGVYGVMSCRVNSQLRQIAVRQAIGAQPCDVVSHILSQAVGILVPGLLLGLMASIAVSRFLASLLYEVKPNDPRTLITVSICVLAAGLAACSVPAVRAVRLDPVVLLRQD